MVSPFCIHRGAVRQTLCKVCQPLPPQQCGHEYRFSASRSCGPAGWLAMLLIKAGDIETNQLWVHVTKQD